MPPFHGKSLVPAFAKDDTVKHDYLWWNHDGNRAIRVGDWKLVADHTQPWELYDLQHGSLGNQELGRGPSGEGKELEQAWIKHAEEFHALSLQDPPHASPPGKQRRGKIGKAKAATAEIAKEEID